MAIVGLDRRLLEVNPAFERMFGCQPGEMIGRAAAEFTHPEDREHAGAVLDEVLADGIDLLDASRRYPHRNGKTIWAHANVAVVRDDQGTPSYLLVQLGDVGAEPEAEKLPRANAEDRTAALEASNRHLQLFADAVAHDLRAPLRSIESFSALLASRAGEQLDDTARSHLDRIRNAAARMSGLLTELGELSHVTRVELKSAPVDLSLLGDWVGAELQDAEPERVVELTVQPGLTVQGDEHLLKMLLAQLLENAWKFSRGRTPAKIEFGGRRDGDRMRLHVRDNGSGFDMRYAPKLFQPFQRLHGPEEGGGHGLGLAIAQRIAERHHGQLRAESEPGAGSTFHLDLPVGETAPWHDPGPRP